MMKKINKTLPIAAVVLAGLAGTASAQGQTSEALMDTLVRKGILTEQEAEDLKADVSKENKQFNKLSLGSGTVNLKIAGDFRARYEGFYASEPAFTDRNRFRYRLRVGATALLSDNFEVGLRLTSSEPVGGFGGDPISGNTTFSDNASKKFVFVDLAYAKWSPKPSDNWSATTIVGKMENPFIFSDMVFDGDYTPEGIAQQLVLNLHENHTLRGAIGGFAMEEVSGNSNDAYLLGAQLRADSKWNKNISTSAGVGVLGILGDQSLVNGAIPNGGIGNTRLPSTAPAYNFNPIVADASLTYKLDSFPMYNGAFPIKVGAEFMHNPAAPERNNAYAGGITFGKSGKKGLWDLSYRYKVLEGDAWFEELVDSDFGAFYGGAFRNSGQGGGYRSGTNVRGHIIKASYNPVNSVTLGLTWFLTEAIDEVPIAGRRESEMSRLQVDAVWKF